MTINRPNILAVGQLPPPIGGLANNMNLYLSSSLADAYDITCLNLSARLKREKNPDKPSLMTILYAISVVFRLIYLLVKISPDLIYMKAGTKWGFLRDVCIILACKLFRKKLVCHLHSKSSGTLFLDNALLRLIFRCCMRFPDKVIVLSENLKKEFAKLIIPEKLEHIDDIINTSLFVLPNSVDRQKHVDVLRRKERIKILFVGRLSESKGIWDLLEVVSILVTQGKKVKFELAGLAEDEHQELKIKEYCAKADFKDSITLLGTISGKTKILTFMNADIFFFPTHNDNTPNTVLEAMAAGLPIVSTNVGEIPHMVKDRVNGFIVERGDCEQLAQKLILLIEAPEVRDRMRQTNYKKAREVYDVEIGVKKMSKVFDNLLSSRSHHKSSLSIAS